MSSFNFSDYSDSPTILLAPQSHPFDTLPQASSPQLRDQTSTRTWNFSFWTPPGSTATIMTNPSKKRSRDEDSVKSSYFPPTPPPRTSPDPIYGEGMTTINPSKGLAISAESQTGTWYETRLEATSLAERLASIEEPQSSTGTSNGASQIYSRKSQRLDNSSRSIAPISSPLTNSLHTGPQDLAIDQFTHLLGVGWASVGDEPDTQAAARGCAKYIENHYPLAKSEILSKSKGLDACLVKTNHGFFLFKEDLSEGRLVGSSWEACLANLQCSPLVFESEETLKAVRTPDLIGVQEEGKMDMD